MAMGAMGAADMRSKHQPKLHSRGSKRIVLFIRFLALSCTLFAFTFESINVGHAAASSQAVRWTFTYVNSFPGQIRIFEVPDDYKWEVGEMFAFPNSKILPFTKLAPELIPVEPRNRKTLALVIENPTDKPWYFFANFHKMYPAQQAFGANLVCLCTNHIFEVKARSHWVRIVQVKTYDSFQKKILELRHEIVGLTADEMKKKNLRPASVADE